MLASTLSNSMPRIALADWRLPFNGSQALGFTAWCGLHDIQIDFGGPGRAPSLDSVSRLRAIRDASIAHDVNVLAVACNQMNDLGLHSAVHSPVGEKVRSLVMQTLDAAAFLGASMVFFPSFRKSAIGDRQTLEATARLLQWACEQGEQRALLVANENDLDVQASRRLVEHVNQRNFRLILDTYNPVKVGVRPSTLILELPSVFASQVHVKDGRSGLDASVPLGFGDGSVAETLDTLRDIQSFDTYVLENDYRCGDPAHLQHDLGWLLNATR
ncbi:MULTISPECIES: sugar phosphate isomerase/epimerase [Pseudomonas]|uniref:TIM barrel protein n=1 Tax=Pseudomonas wuhanensis TaxID=2954098 RepID=A0ABY9GLS5_9PSED|nr:MULTISPECIES: TIM barrel protein [unclassified Pseudomonas]WLI10860.1 TIM barrel protein [Pseudomonas sp. FP603]WLI16685.1 TIM barrel protein [Pseudomonas sp. FP607]